MLRGFFSNTVCINPSDGIETYPTSRRRKLLFSSCFVCRQWVLLRLEQIAFPIHQWSLEALMGLMKAVRRIWDFDITDMIEGSFFSTSSPAELWRSKFDQKRAHLLAPTLLAVPSSSRTYYLLPPHPPPHLRSLKHHNSSNAHNSLQMNKRLRPCPADCIRAWLCPLAVLR